MNLSSNCCWNLNTSYINKITKKHTWHDAENSLLQTKLESTKSNQPSHSRIKLVTLHELNVKKKKLKQKNYEGIILNINPMITFQQLIEERESMRQLKFLMKQEIDFHNTFNHQSPNVINLCLYSSQRSMPCSIRLQSERS